MMKETQYVLDSISTLIDISKVEESKENIDYKIKGLYGFIYTEIFSTLKCKI